MQQPHEIRDPPSKGKPGIARIAQASFNSLAGLKDAWSEPAFRIEALLAAVLVPLALWLPVTAVEKVLLVAGVVLVLIVEVLNSSLETVVDRISLDRDPLSRRAKDLGSAAVMLALLLCGFVWAAILLPLAR